MKENEKKLPLSLVSIFLAKDTDDVSMLVGNIKLMADIVFECVLVDQGSPPEVEDLLTKTCEDSKIYVKYIRRRKKGVADPDREFAYNCANNGHWILSLDLDEKISAELADAIPALLQGDAHVHWIRFINIVDGIDLAPMFEANGYSLDDPHPRLFRKGSVTWPKHPHVHPMMNTPLIGYCRHPIEHVRMMEKVCATHKSRNNMVAQTGPNIVSQQNKFENDLRNYLAAVKAGSNAQKIA